VEWAQVGVAFKDQYTLILRDAVRFADGSVGTYIRTIAPVPGVVVLPIWQGQVLLIKHFRHATRSWHLEIPRGFGEDADARKGALRELEEEIGATGVQLLQLGEMYPDTGASNSRVALFYAEISTYGRPEATEAITEILPTPITEFERMIGNYQLTDGFLLAAYARAKARGLL
jgi:ADP-ribose pyrophosphatase